MYWLPLKKTPSFFPLGYKARLANKLSEAFCAGVVEWLICEITGGEEALNAKYIKLKSF